MSPYVADPMKMNPTRNSMREAARAQMAETLNCRLADVLDLQGQCKHAHWNVRGSGFMALHLMFDSVHASVSEYADTMAERIVQLGGTAEGTARHVAEYSQMEEYPPGITLGQQHLQAMSNVLAMCGARMRFAIQEADELEDAGTADICTEVSRGLDKWLWMVEAHLQTTP